MSLNAVFKKPVRPPGLALACMAAMLPSILAGGIGEMRLVSDIAPQPQPLAFESIHLLGDRLLFEAGERAWSADLRTGALDELGPIALPQVNPYFYFEVPPLFHQLADGTVYFLHYTEEGWYEYLKTDGTPEGTVPGPEIGPGQTGSILFDEFRVDGNRLFSFGLLDGSYGWWKLEDETFTLVAERDTVLPNPAYGFVEPVENGVHFISSFENGSRPVNYLADDSSEPLSVPFDPADRISGTLGNSLFAFREDSEAGNRQLLRFDPDNGGVSLVYETHLGNERVPSTYGAVPLDQTGDFVLGWSHLWIFREASARMERLLENWLPWEDPSDPTTVPRLNPLFVRDQSVYFFASSTTENLLCRIGLNGEGLEIIRDFGDESFNSIDHLDEGAWYLTTTAPDLESLFSERRYTIWKTDGTASGTEAVFETDRVIDGPIVWNRNLIMNRRMGPGSELILYEVDTGTLRRWSIPQAESPNRDGISKVHGVFDGRLLFEATAEGYRHETPHLWVSDGSAAGTLPVEPRITDIISVMAGQDSTIVWTRNRHPASAGSGVWRLDPLTASAEQVQKPASLPFPDQKFDLINVGNHVLVRQAGQLFQWNLKTGSLEFLLPVEERSRIPRPFQASPSGSSDIIAFLPSSGGMILSDGTAAGTRVLFESMPGNAQVQRAFQCTGSTVYFVADTPGQPGGQLWRVDQAGGTPSMIKQLSTSQPVPDYLDLGVIGELCVFRADDSVHGYEPWVTDGTPEGTRLLRDIREHWFGSFPMRRGQVQPDYLPSIDYSGFSPLDGRLYFQASDSIWMTDGTPEGTQPLLTPNGEPLQTIQRVIAFPDALVFENPSLGIWILEDTLRFYPCRGWRLTVNTGSSHNRRVFRGEDSWFILNNDPAIGAELFAIDRDTARGFFSNARDAESGWLVHPVYNWIYGFHYPWVWIQDAGTWAYCVGPGTPEASLYLPGFGWIVSPDVTWPWVYQLEPGEWRRLP